MLIEGLHHISLASSDIKKTLKFYTDLFDFEVLEETSQHAIIKLEPWGIRFNHIAGFKSQIKNPGETSLSFILDVDDFTDAINELETKKIEIIKGPLAIESGESLLIADPDGHLIELFYQE